MMTGVGVVLNMPIRDRLRLKDRLYEGISKTEDALIALSSDQRKNYEQYEKWRSSSFFDKPASKNLVIKNGGDARKCKAYLISLEKWELQHLTRLINNEKVRLMRLRQAKSKSQEDE